LKTDHKEEMKDKVKDNNQEAIEKAELMKEETIDHKEETIIDPMIEILIEEDNTTTTDHQEDNLKDMNQEDNNTEKELQFNGPKSIKSVQEMIDSISSLR